MDEQLPKRKPTRLGQFDYSTPGAYFLTICAQNAAEIFSRVYRTADLEPPVVELTACGRIIERNILDIPKHYPNYTVDNYAIMPNHLHILLTVSEPHPPDTGRSVSDVLCAFKSLCAVQCRKELGMKKIWQRSFNDHIIRGDKDYTEIQKYIEYNSEKWLQSRE